MKLLKVFALFIVLQLAAWGVAHAYQSRHPSVVLLVADTSYAMKPKFAAVQDWIDNYAAKTRYKTLLVGTDKAVLGNLSDLKSTSVIFRTAFGRITAESLARYNTIPATQKILLSDGSLTPTGWTVVKF